MTAPGLCGSCAHARVIRNRHGSVFFLCQRSRRDPRFPRYPPLPVVRCIGYEPRDHETLAEGSETEEP